MIERYTYPEIASIWEDENRFRIWLRIELLACEAQAELGRIPAQAVEEIRSRARFEVQRIREIEAQTQHETIAFLTNLAEHVGPAARFIHYGMTSSDVIDTAFSVQLKEAGELLYQKLDSLKGILAQQALRYKHTPMVGRTHGVHAEPITFGLKLAIWYSEMQRHLKRLEQAIQEVAVGKISGAVGTFAHLEPYVEEYVCRHLGLKPVAASNQIIQRDRHATYMAVLAGIASSLEKIAQEVRHLQRTEVLEVEEPFASGQKGSSAMPHKKNPILSERISGMARLFRGYLATALENVALWHERDISHSSVERIIFPDATIALYYMLEKTCQVLNNLVVHEENMKKNLGLTRGLIFSQAVLLRLVEKGLSREEAYHLVQRNALKVWDQQTDLQEQLKQDPEVMKHLSPEELESLFQLQTQLRHVDTIFKRLELD